MKVIASFKQRQQILLYGLVGVLAFIIFILLWVILGDTNKASSKASLDHKTSITTGTSRVNPQEIWVHKFSTEAELTNKRLDALEQLLGKLLKMNSQQSLPHATNTAININLEDKENPQTEAEGLRSELDHLKDSELKQKEGSFQLASYPQGQLLPPIPITNNKESGFSSRGGTQSLSAPGFSSKAVQKVSIRLHNSKAHQLLKTTDNTIPAGAFARAILLGGVDASTSIQSASDPRPVLLRVTDPGTLPRKFKSDLKGCHVLAASYGDISSERVFMRLEKLTCVERKTGEVVEMNVQGYVAGEDGRAGLRGTVVDRAGESMRNALVGGFFSGMGSFLSEARNPVTFSPMSGLAQTNPLSNETILKHGASKGASNALEKYADFYIKRAEQLQPVIQVAAGRPVDIVFSQGLAFGESAIRQAVGKVNDQKRHLQIQAIEEPSLSPEKSGPDESVQAWLPSEHSTTGDSK
jgi:conjugal transfer pilus assembly protein TraB